MARAILRTRNQFTLPGKKLVTFLGARKLTNSDIRRPAHRSATRYIQSALSGIQNRVWRWWAYVRQSLCRRRR
jgi:hypothetical protein